MRESPMGCAEGCDDAPLATATFPVVGSRHPHARTLPLEGSQVVQNKHQKVKSLPVSSVGYHTVAEVADRHRTGPEQVHRWIRSGRLAALRIGRLVRIPSASLECFEREHTIESYR